MPAKLLIADDSTTIQKVFERTFPPEEFTLSFVGNGEEALTQAKTDRPNVIIADINMPVKNGFELCAELKKDPALKGIPVLLLIGILDDFDEDESRRVGADGFIVKPFEANAAISKVREALAKGGSALPKEGPAAGGAQELMEMADIAGEPAAAAPPAESPSATASAGIARALEGSGRNLDPGQFRRGLPVFSMWAMRSCDFGSPARLTKTSRSMSSRYCSSTTWIPSARSPPVST